MVEFLLVGWFMMNVTFLVDCVYFWINNFRTKLKKIIVEGEPSSITISWIKKLKLLGLKYAHHKIKSVETMQLVGRFREDIDINAHMQYLIFGQYVTVRRQAQMDQQNLMKQLKNMQGIRRMKTDQMKETRLKQKEIQNDKSGNQKALFMLSQFNQLKRIASNQSIRQRKIQKISVDIMTDIIDEIRRDRKIKMAIEDVSYIKEYIKIDLYDEFDSPEKQEVLRKKDEFRKDFAQRLSQMQIDYMNRTINALSNNKAVTLNHLRFNEKIEKLYARENEMLEQGILNNGHDDEMMAVLNINFSFKVDGETYSS